MKKYLLYMIFSTALFSSCKKSIDPAPGERPEERTSAALKMYSDTLTGNTFGWKAFLYPEGGGVYLFSMKFGTNDRVNMISDINEASISNSLESTYRLRAQQAPSLLFDTYSYIHLLADPDPSVNGGAPGNGYNSDFEFYFDKIVGDSIKLVGNRLGSKLVLVKATSEADYDSFPKGTLDVLNKLGQLRTYFKRATVGGLDCEVKVDPTNKELTFSYLKGAALTSVTGGFYVNGSTMVFINSITVGTAKITEIKNVAFDVASRIFSGTINETSFQLKEAIAPLVYDKTTAAKFNANDFQFSSSSGFTKDGQKDAFGIFSIPGLSQLLLWTKYDPDYDLAGFTFGNSIQYGPAVTPTVKANGLVTYTLLGYLGTIPTVPAYRNAVINTGSAFLDPKGFYVIETSPGIFDMVAATDARTWITFQ